MAIYTTTIDNLNQYHTQKWDSIIFTFNNDDTIEVKLERGNGGMFQPFIIFKMKKL